MKKLIILLPFCVYTYLVNAQSYTPVIVETPNQTSFYADSLTSGDLTSTQKNDARNFWLNCYNNRITYINEATYKYNCHGYAWNVSEGGSKVWIDTPDDDKYWDDCSYLEVTNQTMQPKSRLVGHATKHGELVWIQPIRIHAIIPLLLPLRQIILFRNGDVLHFLDITKTIVRIQQKIYIITQLTLFLVQMWFVTQILPLY